MSMLAISSCPAQHATCSKWSPTYVTTSSPKISMSPVSAACDPNLTARSKASRPSLSPANGSNPFSMSSRITSMRWLMSSSECCSAPASAQQAACSDVHPLLSCRFKSALRSSKNATASNLPAALANHSADSPRSVNPSTSPNLSTITASTATSPRCAARCRHPTPSRSLARMSAPHEINRFTEPICPLLTATVSGVSRVSPNPSSSVEFLSTHIS
eukprot:627644-Rhodomonas_salina.2